MGMIKALERELWLNNHLKVSYAVTPVGWCCWTEGRYLSV